MTLFPSSAIALVLTVLIVLLPAARCSPFGSVALYTDGNCSTPFAGLPTWPSSQSFTNWPALNTSQVLIDPWSAQSSACVNFAPSLGGVRSGQYRCEQQSTREGTLGYAFIDVLEWLDAYDCPHSASSGLPEQPSNHYYFYATATASDGEVAAWCLQGFYISGNSSSVPIVLYGQFNCSNAPAMDLDAEAAAINASLAEHRALSVTGNTSAPVHFLRTYNDSDCTQEFTVDTSYYFTTDLNSSEIAHPVASAVRDWLLDDSPLVPPCVSRAGLDAADAIQSGRYLCYQGPSTVGSPRWLSIFQSEAWLASRDCGSNTTLPFDVSFQFLSTGTERVDLSAMCTPGLATVNGVRMTVYAQFACPSNAARAASAMSLTLAFAAMAMAMALVS